MKYLFAGFLSALTAWIFNVYLVKQGGDKAVVLIIPIVEEVLKTGASVLLDAPLVATHLTFGLIEGIHDYLTAKRWGLWAGLISIISHWIFGKTTAVAYDKTGLWLFGILAALILHVLWNYIMITLFSRLNKTPQK